MNLKELLKQRVDDGDLLPDLPQEFKDKNTEIAKAYKEGYEQGKKDAERRGRWIFGGEEGWPKWTCSVCGGDGRGDYKICPWCGAKMKEGGE